MQQGPKTGAYYVDPRLQGAKCDVCPLKSNNLGGPVPGEQHAGAYATMVTDYPSKDDCDNGRVVTGGVGHYLLRALSSLGMKRSNFNYTAALMCRPPGGDLSKLRRKLKVINKDRVKNGKDPLLDPIECCRPRLQADLAATSNVLPLGVLSLEAVAGVQMPLMKWRGAPLSVGKLNVVPIFHPTFVEKQKKWTRAFRVDIIRAVRHFTGSSEWVSPRVRIHPTVEEVREFLARNNVIAHDYETTREGQLRASVYCLGIGNTREVLVIPFKSLEDGHRFYSERDEAQLKVDIAQAMLDQRKLWVGHNSRIFDDVVSERFFGVRPVRHADTIMFHRSVESELPHKLEYVGSVWTTIDRAWKATKAGTEAKSDRELHEYNALDIVITARVLEPLAQAVQQRGQDHIVRLDHQMQTFCRGMHENGMLVDRKRRDEWDTKLKTAIYRHKKFLKAKLGEKFNPASTVQVQDLLYDTWDLPVMLRSKKTEAPSTSAEALIGLRLDGNATEEQIEILDSMRMYRRYAALRGTRIARLRLPNEPFVDDPDHIWEEDDQDTTWSYEAEEARFRTKDAEKEALLHLDGCLHPSWMPHAAPTGRFGAQLVQNWPRPMRDIFIAGEDGKGRKYVLIAVDGDQIELRALTNLSKCKFYLDAFANKEDPHTLNALLVLGDLGRQTYERALAYVTALNSDMDPKKLIKKARKDHEEWSRNCDFAKKMIFSAVYRALVETVHKTIRQTEDEKGVLRYADMEFKTLKAAYDKWLGGCPEIPQWWERDLNEYRAQGFLIEPVTGRRRDFADGEDENEIANFKCQSLSAGVMNTGTVKLMAAVPHQGEFGPGAINQIHDSILMRVYADRGAEVLKIMTDTLEYSQLDLPVKFTFSGKEGWSKNPDGTLKDPQSRWSYTE